MIYTDWTTLEDRVTDWWEARGCRPEDDIAEYAARQPVETLEDWRDWLRAELASWRDAAAAAADALDALEDGEPTDDPGTAYDQAHDNAHDCRRMLKAVSAKLEELKP